MKTLEARHSFQLSIESTKIQIENVQHRLINEPIHSHSHGESCYEIHYINNGNGKLKLDGKTYELTPGKLFVAGPHIKHAQTPDLAASLDEYYVYFNIKKMPSSLSSIDSEWSVILSAIINSPSWFGKDKYNAAFIMKELINTALKKEVGYQAEFKGLFLQFIVRLAKNCLPDKYIKNSNLTTDKSASIHKIIENSFSRFDITLEKIASDLFLSRRQTERIIKGLYGKNFSQKKLEARMLAASDLLISTNMSINQISDKLCYSSMGHFSNQFKQYFGKTPSKYRKNNLFFNPLD